MKILFITFSTFSFGARSMSAYLRSLGHETGILFEYPFPYEAGVKLYSKSTVEAIGAVAREYDLIALSFLTNYEAKARQVAGHLRHTCGKTVVTGNVHAMARPTECLDYSDYVCVGEGEFAMGELLTRLACGEETGSIPGLWVSRGGRVIDNGVARLVRNLDELPFPDYDLKQKYLVHGRQVAPVTELDFKQYFFYGCFQYAHQFFLIASRGCPLTCSYCQNSLLKELYRGEKYVRRNSNQYLIDFMKQVVGMYPFIDYVMFEDDSFFHCSEAILAEWVDSYRREIGLPFRTYADPLSFSEAKLDILMAGGLNHLVVGIQSGNERINREIYRRNVKVEQYMEIIRALRRRRDRLHPITYDFLLGNPYATRREEYDSLRLFATLPRPNGADPYFLTPFPGTELSRRMIRDGLITDERKEVYGRTYRKVRLSYNYIAMLHLNDVPETMLGNLLVRALCSRPAYYLGEWALRVPPVRWMYWASMAVYCFYRRCKRGIKRLIQQCTPKTGAVQGS